MILCGRSPRHFYVANRICTAARPVAIVLESGSQWSARRLLRAMRPKALWRKAWRWLRDRRRYTGNREEEYFFGDRKASLDRGDLSHEVPYINHPEVVALADRLKPDIIAVFGTSLIRAPLLGKGRLGMVNLHGGLSPEYRGADCTFWALYNGEPEKIGCTLHFIDAGIDTGDLIAHVCPEIREDDNELKAFWRAVRDSAEIYAELFDRMEAGEQFDRKQPGPGRLYRVRDRTWERERKLDSKMRDGLLRGVRLPARVQWYSREELIRDTR